MTGDRDPRPATDPAWLSAPGSQSAVGTTVTCFDLRPTDDDEFVDEYLLTFPLGAEGSTLVLTLSRNELEDLGLALGDTRRCGEGYLAVLAANLDITADPNACTIQVDLDGGHHVLAVIPHPGLAELARAITEAVGQ